MRSVLLCTASAILFAGCTLPPCFDCCPLLDPAQYGCGPRVPYCTSPPGCGAYGSVTEYGPPINGYPASGGLSWGQPAFTPGCPVTGAWNPQTWPQATVSGAGNPVQPQATDVVTTAY